MPRSKDAPVYRGKTKAGHRESGGGLQFSVVSSLLFCQAPVVLCVITPDSNCAMRVSQSFCIVLLFFIIVQQGACSKEYSYEGGDAAPVNDTTVIQDSLAPLPENNIYCALCNENDSVALGSWRFSNNQSYFCGTTTDAGFIGASTFTFFGPSACSADSGMVITVYLPMPFTDDKYQVTSNTVAFYYYDHTSTTDMFIKLPPLPFSATVESYIQSTGIATGTFEGLVYKADGDTTHIRNGKFKVRLQ